MNETALYLSTLTKEMKRSYETPVILLTGVDFGDSVYTVLTETRECSVRGGEPDRVADLVTSFHHDWLKATKDLPAYRLHLRDKPRHIIYEAIEQTIASARNRYPRFKVYIENLLDYVSEADRGIIEADVKVIEDMHENVVSVLQEKRAQLQNLADHEEFINKIEFEIDELLNWLDRIYDNLSVQICKIINLDVTFIKDLTKTLNEILAEVSISDEDETIKNISEMEDKGVALKSTIRTNSTCDLEITTVLNKIKVLEERIARLRDNSSAAVTALQHKKIYLEGYLRELQQLKTSMHKLQLASSLSNKIVSPIVSITDAQRDNKDVQIFNHLLPEVQRYRLVDKLINLWRVAIYGQRRRKSVITILSAGDIREQFSDDHGLDRLGRKLVNNPGSSSVHQINEKGDRRVYFYDELSHKVDRNSSEYFLNDTTYCYDDLGGYLNDNYEQKDMIFDSFHNLVFKRNVGYEPMSECAPLSLLTEASQYLKQTVSKALKECLVDVILHTPQDPIIYLAERLEKYRQNIQLTEKSTEEKQTLSAARKQMIAVRVNSTSSREAYSETDVNFVNYRRSYSKIIDDLL